MHQKVKDEFVAVIEASARAVLERLSITQHDHVGHSIPIPLLAPPDVERTAKEIANNAAQAIILIVDDREESIIAQMRRAAGDGR